MIEKRSLDKLQDLLTRDPSTVRERLANAGQNEFIRIAANILENTKRLDDLRGVVDLEELARQFPKIKNHMSHAKIEGSYRAYWEETLAPFQAKEKPERQTNDTQPPVSDETVAETTSDADGVGKSLLTEAGKKLAELRQSRNISRTEIQKNMGISLNQLDEVETGDTVPSLGLVLRYAAVLDVKPHLEFSEDEVSTDRLRQNAEQLIGHVIDEMEIQDPLRKYCRAILIHMLEHGLYQKQYRSLEMVLEHIQEMSKDFAVDPDGDVQMSPFVGGLNDLLLEGLSRLELTDLAFEEKVRILAHKALEKVHDNHLRERNETFTPLDR